MGKVYSMTTNYLDSKRISVTGIGSLDGVGGWKELGRTTLGSAGDTISVGSLADKRYLMFLCDTLNTGGSTQPRIRGGNSTVDTGSNYSQRMQRNGAADATGTSDQSTYLYDADNSPQFMVGYYANLSAKEKLGLGHTVVQSTAGAGTAPLRQETVWKHAFTSNPYDVISINNIYGAGDFNTGSELVVLGWDESDTHTTNFWEELASVELGSASATLDSGTFTAKKYLWIQAYINATTVDTGLTFNSDTGNNYARRWSDDGASDGTAVNGNNIQVDRGNSTQFLNMFIVNNSANEKLGMYETVTQNTAGAGNVPSRREMVFKWTNTSSQITKSVFTKKGSGTDLQAGSIIKVWGHD